MTSAIKCRRRSQTFRAMLQRRHRRLSLTNEPPSLDKWLGFSVDYIANLLSFQLVAAVHRFPNDLPLLLHAIIGCRSPTSIVVNWSLAAPSYEIRNRAATIVNCCDLSYPEFDMNLSEIQSNRACQSPDGCSCCRSSDAFNAVVGCWYSPTEDSGWRPSDVNTQVNCGCAEPVATYGRVLCSSKFIDHSHRMIDLRSERYETMATDDLFQRSKTLCRNIMGRSHSTDDNLNCQFQQQYPTVTASNGIASIGRCATQQHSRYLASVAATSTAASALNAVASTATSQTSAASQLKTRRRRKSKDALVPLISRAIMSSADCRLALADICRYICDRSIDYPSSAVNGGNDVPLWQSNVRHTLSHYEFFVKDGRLPTGRGNYWTVHPICRQRFGDGDFRIKRARHLVQQHEKSLKNKRV